MAIGHSASDTRHACARCNGCGPHREHPEPSSAVNTAPGQRGLGESVTWSRRMLRAVCGTRDRPSGVVRVVAGRVRNSRLLAFLWKETLVPEVGTSARQESRLRRRHSVPCSGCCWRAAFLGQVSNPILKAARAAEG